MMVSSGKVRLLREDDLDQLSWTGDICHQEYIRDWFARTHKLEMELIGLEIDGTIIAFACIDYKLYYDAGLLKALSVKQAHQSKGFGSELVKFAQQRVIENKKNKITLHVEIDNVRAIDLYKRLNFQIVRLDVESWEEMTSSGERGIYNADIYVMEKTLVDDGLS